MDDCIYTLEVLRWAMRDGCFDIEFQRSFLTTPPIFHRSRLFFLFSSSSSLPPLCYPRLFLLRIFSSPPLVSSSLQMFVVSRCPDLSFKSVDGGLMREYYIPYIPFIHPLYTLHTPAFHISIPMYTLYTPSLYMYIQPYIHRIRL